MLKVIAKWYWKTNLPQIFVEEGCMIIGRACLLELFNFLFSLVIGSHQSDCLIVRIFLGMFSHIRIHTMNNCVMA